MGLIDTTKKFFAQFGLSNVVPNNKVAATRTITNDITTYLLSLSDFNNMQEDAIYEQLYVWEPEIGASIDRMSTMVGESFKSFTSKTLDFDKMTAIERKMVDEANKMAETLDIRSQFEIFSEILQMHGNLYIDKTDTMTMRILPNKYVTILDNTDRIKTPSLTGFPSDIMTQGNWLVLYEQLPGQRILNKESFTHVKYKATPVFMNDNKGRLTYGIYSPSPLHRVIIPIWWKRQTMIIDIMWRLRNVPREHHKVSAEMFSIEKYQGDMTTRRTAAMADAKSFLDTYVKNIKTQMPDQGYATLDTVDISMIDSGSSHYMQTNELISQINDGIWSAMNIPKSMISGESSSSYASELIIAKYVSQKVMQLSARIKPVILENMKMRLRSLDSSFPVDKLDMKVDIDISDTSLDKFRQLAIMATIKGKTETHGIFTEDELREIVGYAPLVEDQRQSLVLLASAQSQEGTPGSALMGGGKGPDYPESPQSQSQHATDKGTQTTKKTS